MGDFRTAVASGVDEITHLPVFGEITPQDAALARMRGVVVITTAGQVNSLPPMVLPPPQKPAAMKREASNLSTLHAAGVRLAIGSDDVNDTSVGEVALLRSMGSLDDHALLKIWTGATAKAIFPKRSIGELSEGFEASFLALAGDPLSDWSATRQIVVRFKQGHMLQP